MIRVGCPSCGVVKRLTYINPCSCTAELVLLRTAADRLAFHLLCEGRDDEATAVLSDHAQLKEGHGSC